MKFCRSCGKEKVSSRGLFCGSGCCAAYRHRQYKALFGRANCNIKNLFSLNLEVNVTFRVIVDYNERVYCYIC